MRRVNRKTVLMGFAWVAALVCAAAVVSAPTLAYPR